MPGDRLVVDGLWRCLCPSIDIASLSKPIDLWRLPLPVRQVSTFTNRNTHSEYPQRQCRRQYNQLAAIREHKTQHDTATEKSHAAYLQRLAKRTPWIPGNVLEGTDHFNANLDKIPTRDLYATLKELRNSENTYLLVTGLVEYLVKERGERPNAALYESLIKANVSKQYGSAKAAGQLLKEVQMHNIPTTQELYQAILEVTAVHPDYVLRSQVLHDMKNRWYNLTPSAEISIIIALLRDSQYELALVKLEELNRIPINVPPWLLDVFLYTFGDLGFHEETLAILKHRQKVVDVVKRVPLSLNAWQFLLEVFSRDAFQPGIKFVWDHSVAQGSIHPPDGVVLNVLNAASMYGDLTLAMSAIKVLSLRGTKLDMHHYEALVHIHIQHGDLRKAFTVLCIMVKAGLSPDLASTRQIFQKLRTSSSSTDQALKILHELRLQYTIPAAAFNVVLEAAATHGGFKVASDLYRTIRQVCTNGPDLQTFDILLRYCTLRKSMDFLLAEMEAFSLKPSQVVFDHLVRICSIQDNYEMAFHYIEMMRTRTPPGLSEPWWISKNSALALIRRCIQARDPRFQRILEECRRRRIFLEDDIEPLMRVEEQSRGVLQSIPYSSVSFEQESPETERSPFAA